MVHERHLRVLRLLASCLHAGLSFLYRPSLYAIPLVRIPERIDTSARLTWYQACSTTRHSPAPWCRTFQCTTCSPNPPSCASALAVAALGPVSVRVQGGRTVTVPSRRTTIRTARYIGDRGRGTHSVCRWRKDCEARPSWAPLAVETSMAWVFCVGNVSAVR